MLKFLGLGARACFIGRAYLYGLGAYGQAGVTKALEILKDELSIAMALTGVTDVAKVPRDIILRAPPAPDQTVGRDERGTVPRRARLRRKLGVEDHGEDRRRHPRRDPDQMGRRHDLRDSRRRHQRRVRSRSRQRQDKIRFVQVRHEEAAAFAACAYAKFTGKLGVCLATSGPGGIHLLNGIYDAKLDNQPVLAITGAQHHDLIETYTQQDVALDKLFMDATAYSVRVMGPAHVEDVVEQACRTALAYRQPTHVMIPVDFQSQPAKDRSERNVAHHVSNIMARGGQLPDPRDAAARRRHPEPGGKAVHPRRPRLDRRDRRAARRRRAAAGADRQAAARQGRRCPTRAPTRPAASACSAPSRPRKRWKAATRC